MHSWMLDKTGTINTSLLNHREILQQEMIDIRGVLEAVLEVHGVLPGRKEEGIMRLLYENANGLSNRMCSNKKLDKCRVLLDELGADIIVFNEHRAKFEAHGEPQRLESVIQGG